MQENTEFSGYLEVKIPVNLRRGFTPWKAWKRQWCILKQSNEPVEGIVIQLGNNPSNSICIPVPRDATLCRTESRSRRYAFGIFLENKQPILFLSGSSECHSQKWISHIRSLLKTSHITDGVEVSLIDNDHSRAAKLTGLYGTLTTDCHGVKIYDTTTGEIRAIWRWSQLHQFHLGATDNADDKDKVCVIHTSSEFCAGPGQLLLFCEEAPKLLKCLLNKGSMAHLTKCPLPNPSIPFYKGRRLSRSENDLRNLIRTSSVCSQQYSYTKQSSLARSHSGSGSRDSGVRLSGASDESDGLLRGKVASSLLSAGLGLMFSTPGCSEADSESLHEYQQVGFCISDEELTKLDNRRESGFSVASGIYEEIPDIVHSAAEDTESHYANIYNENESDNMEKTSTSPPPLPPRKFNCFTAVSSEDLRQNHSIPTCIPPPLLARFNRARCYSDSSSFKNKHQQNISHTSLIPEPWSKRDSAVESDYMPMSPSVKTPVSAAEEYYVAMASLKLS